jgi:hypothetical protein
MLPQHLDRMLNIEFSEPGSRIIAMQLLQLHPMFPPQSALGLVFNLQQHQCTQTGVSTYSRTGCNQVFSV